MPAKKKEFETELVVANILTEDDRVTLELRFTKPRFKELTEKRLAEAIQPIARSPMKKMGRENMEGVMEITRKQLQQQTQQLAQFLPRPPSPDTVRITLSKQEYTELGRPRPFDKLTLGLRMKKS